MLAHRRFLRAVDEVLARSFLLHALDLLHDPVGHLLQVLRRAGEADGDVSTAALERILVQTDADGVGLAKLLAEDVPQRDLEHVGGRRQARDDVGVRRRVGEKRDLRHHLRLASLRHRGALDAGGELQPDVLDRAGRLPLRRQGSDVAGDQRQRLLHLERADHQEREVRRVREELLVRARHRFAVEPGDAFARDRLGGVMVR